MFDMCEMEKVYFEGMPNGPSGHRLRRHGDQLLILENGYFQHLGRVDDTMNLGEYICFFYSKFEKLKKQRRHTKNKNKNTHTHTLNKHHTTKL